MTVVMFSLPAIREGMTLSYREFSALLSDQDPDWMYALDLVRGTFIVTDSNTGKTYADTVYGGLGMYSYWTMYLCTGHGYQEELQTLIAKEGKEYARRYFSFTLTEIHRLEKLRVLTPDDFSDLKDALTV